MALDWHMLNADAMEAPNSSLQSVESFTIPPIGNSEPRRHAFRTDASLHEHVSAQTQLLDIRLIQWKNT